MDTALNEYSFDKAFFHMEDTSIFSHLFKDTLKYVTFILSLPLIISSRIKQWNG